MTLIWISSEKHSWTGDAQVWYYFWVLPCIIMYTFPNKTKQFFASFVQEGVALSIASMLFSPGTSTKPFFMFFFFLVHILWLPDLSQVQIHCARYYITHVNALRILLLGRENVSIDRDAAKKQNKIFNFSRRNFYSWYYNRKGERDNHSAIGSGVNAFSVFFSFNADFCRGKVNILIDSFS